MTQNTDDLRKRYSSFSDDDLLRIAMKDSADLMPEAFEIMTKELDRRKLKESVSSSIEIQRKTLSSEELTHYCNIIQNQSCPCCKKNDSKLNAILVGEIISMIFITIYENKLVIACQNCLKDKNKNGTLKSLIFGWWGIGIISMIKSLRLNNRMSKYIGSDDPTPTLQNFIEENIGKIEAYKDNNEELQFMLKNAKFKH